MGGVEFHAIQCAHCGLYQVQQVKKTPKFKCTVCNKHQKLQDEHFRGPSKQCREVVQCLNKARAEGEIAFTPLQEQRVARSSSLPATKRTSARSTGESDSKRLKNVKSGEEQSPIQAAKQDARTSDEDDDLFPPAEELPVTSNSVLVPKSTSSITQQAEDDHDDDIFGDVPSPPRPEKEVLPGNLESSPQAIRKSSLRSRERPPQVHKEESREEPVYMTDSESVTRLDDDEDDDMFGDIPSSPKFQKAVPEKHSSASSAVEEPSLKSPNRLLPLNREVVEERNFTDDKMRPCRSSEMGGKGPDTVPCATASRTAYEEITRKTCNEVKSLSGAEKRGSLAATEVKGGPKDQEAWRRRSLNKLAKFRFDVEDDSAIVATASVVNVPPVASMPSKSETPHETCPPKGIGDFSQERRIEAESSPKTPKQSRGSTEGSSSSPGGGRERLLATLHKFKRTPNSKQKL